MMDGTVLLFYTVKRNRGMFLTWPLLACYNITSIHFTVSGKLSLANSL